ncbi:TonB-dependent receptor [Haliea sp. E1-2-M8]|uniref:TonB-dependent receptor n=1 Tax=Haliea sp. E1-2-M8 TaxID=3064706 RepID=UPI00271D83C0|nr:TonB-dependent receptor [Haliea sp. E1-2-M8]MDO8860589.1 TonB-dependent receptor [Haliea sp. E1-2-M8]
MPKNIRTPIAAALIAATTFPVWSVAQAQTLALEEVVVTAQRRETMLQETPIAVTAFSAEKIADLGIHDISDIGSIAPNTNIQKQPSSNSNMSIYIRGVGSGETSLMVDPKTSFYLDGVYMSKTVGSVFDIVDLQSIEVLRGPQGTLFGRNSTGGAVNVTTVKPTGELGGKLEASVGNDGYRRLSGSVDLPKMADMLSLKLSAAKMEYDGWATNDWPGGEEELGSEDNTSYRLALRLEPTDNLIVDYVFDRTDNRGVPTPFQISKVKDSIYNGFTETPFPYTFLGGELYQQMAATVGNPNDRREQYTLDGVSDEYLEVDGHNLTVSWELEPFMIKYIYANRKTDSGYESTDLDGGAYTARDLFYGGGQSIPTQGFQAGIPEGWIDLETHELQLIGDAMNDRLQYTVGLYYYEEDIYQDNPQTFALPIQFLLGSPLAGAFIGAGFCNDFGTGPVCQGTQRLPLPFPFPGADPNMNGLVDFIYGQTTESSAVYGQATYSLTDDLDLTAGLRYTEDKRDGFLFNETLGHSSIDDRLTNSDKWDDLSYLLTLNYAVSPDMNVYLSHSTGYNGGGFNSRASTVTAWEEAYDEEQLDSYELGIKSDWLNQRLRLNAALFYNDYQDMQIAVFEAGSGGASSRITNAGASTYQGFELEAVALLSENITLDLTYGYLDAEFDEYNARNPVTNEIENIADITTVTRAPENTGALGLQYSLPNTGIGAFSARVDVSYTDSMTFHPFLNQFDSSDARTVTNARLTLDELSVGGDGELRLSAWVKNLTDEEYREWGIDFGTLGYAGNTWNQPRTFGFDVIYQF